MKPARDVRHVKHVRVIPANQRRVRLLNANHVKVVSHVNHNHVNHIVNATATATVCRIKKNNMYKQLTLMITMDCNMNCSYCFEKGHHVKQYISESTIHDVKTVLNKEKHYLCDSILFFGGEPMLNQKVIIDFIQTYRREFEYVIMTNGSVPFDYLISQTKQYADVIMVDISYDGAANYLRNHKNIYQLIDNVKLLKKYKYKVNLSSVYTLEFCRNKNNLIDIIKTFPQIDNILIERLDQIGQYPDDIIYPIADHLKQTTLISLYCNYKYHKGIQLPDNIQLQNNKEGLCRRSYWCDLSCANITCVGTDGKLYTCPPDTIRNKPYANSIFKWKYKPQFYNELKYNKGYTDCMIRHDTNDYWDLKVNECRELHTKLNEKMCRLFYARQQ